MSQPEQKVKLSPVAEGMVGAIVGALIGGGLSLAGLITPLAILGVAAGVGLGSWFNAWRRSKRDGGS